MNMGYVDPTLVPTCKREKSMLHVIRERGLMLHRVHPNCSTVRLTGPGVFVTACTLSNLTHADLVPVNTPAHARPYSRPEHGDFSQA